MRLSFYRGAILYLGTLVILSTAALQMLMSSMVSMSNQLQPRYLQRREVSVEDVKRAGSRSRTPSSVTWFVQVTDLHISKFRGFPGRSDSLGSVCRFLKSHVRPSAAVVTGDIVDAKDYKLFGSEQYPEEWEAYSGALRSCDPNFPWLDIRGNHDAFDVHGEEHPTNMFRRFSSQGGQHPRSYMERVVGPDGSRTCLVGVDATPSPGLKRLFNFFGVLTKEEVSVVSALLSESERECNSTVTFGHYPSSAVSSYGEKNLRELLSGHVYLCGHYHTGGGFFPHMYTRHPTGMLELELGDWKDERMYRLFAFDRGVFSFSDQPFSEEGPNVAAVVTSPRSPRFAFAAAGDDTEVDASVGATVRALVFSDVGIKRVTLRLEDDIVVRMTNNGTRARASPLYEAEWPEGYLERRSAGLHRLVVRVELEGGGGPEGGASWHRDFDGDFSLDGSQGRYESWADVILLSDWLPFSVAAFAVTTFGVVASLSTARILRHFLVDRCNKEEATQRRRRRRRHSDEDGDDDDDDLEPAIRAKRSFVLRTVLSNLRNFSVLSSHDPLYVPLVASTLYACCLPWCVGKVLTDRLAIVFVWGIFLLGERVVLVSSDMAFILGGLWHVTATFPLLFVLSNAVGRAHSRERRAVNVVSKPPPLPLRLLRLCWTHLGVSVISVMLAQNCVVLWWIHGLVSVLSPWGLGRLALVLVLYRRASGLRRKDFETLGVDMCDF